MRLVVGQAGSSSYVTAHHYLVRKDVLVAQIGNLASIRISEKIWSDNHYYKGC